MHVRDAPVSSAGAMREIGSYSLYRRMLTCWTLKPHKRVHALRGQETPQTPITFPLPTRALLPLCDLQRQVDAQVEAESSELNQNIVGVEHESGGGKRRSSGTTVRRQGLGAEGYGWRQTRDPPGLDQSCGGLTPGVLGRESSSSIAILKRELD
jgi:hypothetical protein